MVADGEYPFFTCARESYRINKYAFDCEALLVSGNGANVGYVHYYNGKFNTYQRTYVISDFSADVHFLKLFLDRNLQDRIRVEVNAGNTPYITMGTLTEMEVVLPSNPTQQRAIAETLSDVDGLIAALNKLIAKKRAIKQAAMQQLLTGKTRLPGFTGEWKMKMLGEIADIKNGSTPSTQVDAFWNGSIPWCIPTDITSTPGKYLTRTERRITKDGLASCAASLLPAGALLLCTRATIGEVKIAATEICTNQGFKSLVCRQDMSNEFLYYLLLTLKHQMLEKAIGSTFLEVGKKDVSSIVISLPQYNEQLAIATVLSDMDAEIEALERRRDKTQQIKQGMMQQLLTGRIRLVDSTVNSKGISAGKAEDSRVEAVS